MTNSPLAAAMALNLMAQSDLPPSVIFGETEADLWPYRSRTAALLRRYARASVEVGRLPSLLGREFFRTRVTSYTMRNFEDVVIFVTDMEQAIEKLDAKRQETSGHECSRGVHGRRGRAPTRLHAQKRSPPVARRARPAVGGAAFGWIAGKLSRG
jgi:hypothetical protein